MTRLPFGGFDANEKPIDSRASPGPLLAELAECLRDGVFPRPALARWIVETYEDGRLEVTQPDGSPEGGSLHLRVGVVLAVRQKLEEAAKAGKKLKVGVTIEQAMRELGSAAERPAYYKWKKELEAAERQAKDSRFRWAQEERVEAAVALFRECSANGMAATEALSAVRVGLRTLGMPAHDDELAEARRSVYGG